VSESFDRFHSDESSVFLLFLPSLTRSDVVESAVDRDGAAAIYARPVVRNGPGKGFSDTRCSSATFSLFLDTARHSSTVLDRGGISSSGPSAPGPFRVTSGTVYVQARSANRQNRTVKAHGQRHCVPEVRKKPTYDSLVYREQRDV